MTPRLVHAPSSRLVRTLNAGKTRRPSGQSATPRFTISVAGRPLMTLPSKRTSPPHDLSRPATVLTVVDLPAPLRPNITAVSPSETAHGTPCSTGTLP